MEICSTTMTIAEKIHNMKLHNKFSVLKILPNWNKMIPQNILEL
jgi:hypothetical protein